MAYLLRRELSEDEVESHQIVWRAKAFTIINNELYKRSTSGVFLRCISPEEGREILNDIHPIAGTTLARALWLPRHCGKVSSG
jgi:hypothetical protein